MTGTRPGGHEGNTKKHYKKPQKQGDKNMSEQLLFDLLFTDDNSQEAKENKTTKEEPRPVSVRYYDINEELARLAWQAVHMREYEKNSATNNYRASVDEAAKMAETQKQNTSSFYHDKIDHLLDMYARKLAEWTNSYNRNDASCPSWFISGPANYPVRKHERKMAREKSLWQEYDEIKNILNKIESVGTGPVDLADPNARAMLTERIESLQNELERGKAINAYYRKHKTLLGFQGLTDEAAAKMLNDFEDTKRRCAWIEAPYPEYELTSMRGKIKRVKARLEELDKREQAQKDGASNNEKFDGGEIVRNIKLDRLQIIFDDKPDEETRNALKRNGFRWSPSNKAWQRQLTENAERALRAVGL